MSVITLMIPAVWRGVPFHVLGSSLRVGRKNAVHEYPFRSTPWVEDMGRASRVISFTGRLVGDDVYLQRAVMQAACELKGPGLLVHPTLGPVQCSLLEPVVMRDRYDAQRVVEFEMVFMQGGDRRYPNLLIDTQNAILVAAAAAVLLVGRVVAAAVSGGGSSAAAVALGSQSVATAWSDRATVLGRDPAAIARETSGLSGYNGRYDGGGLAVPAATSATVASQRAAVVSSRSAIEASVADLNTAAGNIVTNPESCTAAARSTIVAIRTAAISPLDQIRLLSNLSQFQPTITASSAPIGGAIASAQTALASMLRRSALIGLAEAISSYQPDSAEAAQATLTNAVSLLDAEILVAADAGDGDAFSFLRDVRTAVVQDLSERGAKLAHIETFSYNASMPAIALAWKLYQDPTRVRDLIARANAPHPLFMPKTFQALDA
ncbi:DNA circularization protein [Kozakia baliensis]|uniref:Uncharacterized protein n=1 Tax=Kozakia baliensis TaxID=153496 RepID=A0A1D8UTD5_9PROT|nr:DNA circularization N-terminal domain-containing protein [Kozakia baliensis]AOX16918.1 hypothetical protein A0U89_06965 [Kozakia baliensis]GBR25598.1 Mu-like bacteriophage DNA circulation protein [Kozakia baliensis NRIC 0488]GEL64035.1 hypothetical protein KBA01_13210 [Kozakia baliensis]